MSESIPAEIWIGGPVRAADVNDLCAAIEQEGVAIDFGEVMFVPKSAQELLTARTEQGGQLVLRLCDYQASYGQFEELEAFLRQRGIPYDRQSDGKCEFDPLREQFRPGSEAVEQLTDHSGNPTIRLEPLYDVATKLSSALSSLHQGEWQHAQTALEGAYTLLHEHLPPPVPPLPAFEIFAAES